jgi:hypothetical protein
MSIKQLIANDLASIEDPLLLNQIFDYMQIIKKTSGQIMPNRDAVMQWAGSIDDATADALQRTIQNEFSR